MDHISPIEVDVPYIEYSRFCFEGITVISGPNGRGQRAIINGIKQCLIDEYQPDGYTVIDLNFIHRIDSEDISEFKKGIPDLQIVSNNEDKELSVNERVLVKYITRPIERLFHKDVSRARTLHEFVDFADDSGIAMFIFMLMYIRNIHINKKTVFLMNNMPAHMHPIAAVEFARLLLKMRKMLGCYVICTTYNSDFVAAISGLSEIEGVWTQVNYYHFEEDGYMKDEWNSGFIFDSFNRANVMIDLYSGKNVNIYGEDVEDDEE